MTKEECQNETREHIENVRKFLSIIVIELVKRMNRHDKTKLENTELKTFMEYTPKLAKSTYGSEEYKEFLKNMKPALDHHYNYNKHHPEHFEKGIEGMTLVDLIEMFCDWKAATLRHNDGNMTRSIEQNQERFKYSNDLKQIFLNTIRELISSL